MNPVSLGTDSRHQRRRLLALALLLVVSLTLGAALALQAIGTARRHRETAQRTLQDYAGFGAFILASQTYRQLGGEVVQIFTDWPASGTPAAIPRGTECSGGTSYLQQPPGQQLRMSGAAIAPGDLALIQDTLRVAMQLLEEVGWRFRFVRIPSGQLDGSSSPPTRPPPAASASGASPRASVARTRRFAGSCCRSGRFRPR